MNKPAKTGRAAGTIGPNSSAKSATHTVANAIYEMFRRGDLRVGERIPSEWELVRELSVGRSAVREAVRELAALGMIETQRGRGSFVRSLPPEILLGPESFRNHVDRAVRAELGEVRLIFEPEAAALAAQRASPDAIRKLGDDVEALVNAVAAGVKPAEDLGFHLDIVAAAGNNYLSRLATIIVSYYERDDSIPAERDVVEHRAVYDAIRRGSPALARRAMRTHLEHEQSSDRHA